MSAALSTVINFSIMMWYLLVLFGCGPHNTNQGPAGPQGTVGTPGSAGSTGLTGATGAAGTNGISGTIITTIQFCPDVTPAYPSTYPEYGVCINNELYGVYSANGGFWVKLPPGAYSSDGINASCSFTIKPNCEVVQ